MSRTDLDLDHITAVCNRLTQTGIAAGLKIAPALGGYAITAPAIADARRTHAELTRLGYRANVPARFGRRNRVTITGWNRNALAARTARLFEAIAQLSGHLDATATAAIKGEPRHDLADPNGPLRRSWERSAGILTDHAPVCRSTDRILVTQVHEAHRMEREALTQIRRHAQTAESAIRLYEQYRPRMPDPQARTSAAADACRAIGAPPPGTPPPGTPPPARHGAAISTTDTATTPDDTAPADLRRGSAPDHRPGETESPSERPAAIAAHDQPNDTYANGPRAETIPNDAPPPPAITANRPGPARGPAT